MTPRALSLILAFALAGCGVAPTGAALRAPAGQPAAAAASTTLATAFERALEAKYGDLFTPAGGKAHLTHVETYKISGGATRVRGIVEVETKDFKAKLEAMAAVSMGDKVTADYFPRFASAACTKDDFDAAATYAVRIFRIDREQLGHKGKLGGTVDPKKYTVKVLHLDAKSRDLAEVSFQSEGFLGKGSTFTEYYRVNGKRGAKCVIEDVVYHDNKATDPNGNDLDQ